MTYFAFISSIMIASTLSDDRQYIHTNLFITLTIITWFWIQHSLMMDKKYKYTDYEEK